MSTFDPPYSKGKNPLPAFRYNDRKAAWRVKGVR
jgi:hypothetical protein